MQAETVVVTRHGGLVSYLRAEGIIDESTPVYPYCTVRDIQGKHVIGVVPLYLAAAAQSVTDYPVVPPASLRGQSLTEEEFRLYMRPSVTYRVNVLSTPPSKEQG